MKEGFRRTSEQMAFALGTNLSLRDVDRKQAVQPQHVVPRAASQMRCAGRGAGGTRTPYLFNAIEALSQMSYSPTISRERG